MMKKIIPLVALMNIFSVPMVASAVPLDPDHFQAGAWKGTYLSYSCNSTFAGKAVLTITNPVYSPPTSSQHESNVHFSGSLEFQGRIPKGLSKQNDLSDESVILRRFPDNGDRYEVALISHQENGTQSAGGFFIPVIENIQLNVNPPSGCLLHLTLYPSH